MYFSAKLLTLFTLSSLERKTEKMNDTKSSTEKYTLYL